MFEFLSGFLTKFLLHFIDIHRYVSPASTIDYLCAGSLRKLGALAIGVFFSSSSPSCGRLCRVGGAVLPPPSLPKATGSPPLPRFQNRACAFPCTRLLSGAAPVMSTIEPTGLGDALSALHTYLGQAGFMSYACLLAPLPSTPPLPRQPILGITPGLRFLGDPSSTSACG